MLRGIQAPLFIVYGELDHSVKPDQALKLEATLKALGKNTRLVLYPSAGHAFFNDQNAMRYNAEATKDVWPRVVEFFRANLA
jgi:carboxymethylenebutenolidase